MRVRAGSCFHAAILSPQSRYIFLVTPACRRGASRGVAKWGGKWRFCACIRNAGSGAVSGHRPARLDSPAGSTADGEACPTPDLSGIGEEKSSKRFTKSAARNRQNVEAVRRKASVSPAKAKRDNGRTLRPPAHRPLHSSSGLTSRGKEMLCLKSKRVCSRFFEARRKSILMVRSRRSLRLEP